MKTLFRVGIISDADSKMFGNNIDSSGYRKLFYHVYDKFLSTFKAVDTSKIEYCLCFNTSRKASIIFFLAFSEACKQYNVSFCSKAYIMSYQSIFDSIVDKLFLSNILSKVNYIEEVFCFNVCYSNVFHIDRKIIQASNSIICLYNSSDVDHFYSSFKLAEDNRSNVFRLTKNLIEALDYDEKYFDLYSNIVLKQRT